MAAGGEPGPRLPQPPGSDAGRSNAPHPACPACGRRFAQPLPWTARCPACGVSLYLAATRAAREGREATTGAAVQEVRGGVTTAGGGSIKRVLGLVAGVAAVAFFAFGWHSGREPAAAVAPVAGVTSAAGSNANPDEARAQQRRQQEIAECPEGEMATTTAHGPGYSGPVRQRPPVIGFLYNPVLAPEGLPEAMLSDMIRKAANAWSACGIRGEFRGATQDVDGTANTVVFQWYNSDGVPTAGYQKGATIYLNHGHFSSLRSVSDRYAMDMLQTLISHEMGHAFGLREHSARCLDVMATWDSFDKCERLPAANRSFEAGGRRFSVPMHTLPTACDIQRCRLENGTATAAASATAR